ncbi:hypothetical protein CGRA01v4_08889 [Colletotrichum graminicola]|nr:hypothetical protein CGRA01v4_08889 [Colletotrichum graminicola]
MVDSPRGAQGLNRISGTRPVDASTNLSSHPVLCYRGRESTSTYTYRQLYLENIYQRLADSSHTHTHTHTRTHAHTHTLSLFSTPTASRLYANKDYDSPSCSVDTTRVVLCSRRPTRLPRARGPANASLHPPRNRTRTASPMFIFTSPAPEPFFSYPHRLPSSLGVPPQPLVPDSLPCLQAPLC